MASLRLSSRPAAALGACLTTLVALVSASGLAAPVPIPQTPIPGLSANGVVRAVVLGNGTAYVGGDFTSVTGTNGTFPRSHLAAFDLASGAVVTTFAADTNGTTVRAIAVSGTSLFVGGDFTTIRGVGRARVAEVSASTGGVVTAFAANTDATVESLATGGGRLYVAGQFHTIAGLSQPRVAAVDLASRTVVTGFRPAVDRTVHAVAVSPAGDRVYVGGEFVTVNGAGRRYLAALNPAGAAMGPAFSISDTYPVLGIDLNENGSRLFAAVGGTGNQAAAYNPATGARLWRQRADGDVQAVSYSGGNVFFGFHEGFNGDTSVRLLAADAQTGVLEPAFRPAVNSFWGVRALDATAQGLLVGGEFTAVQGVPAGRVAYFRPSSGPGTTLVPMGSAWRYFDAATVPAGWNQPSFGDGGWKSGPAQLGYGDGDEATVLSYGPDPGAKYRAAYFRRTFTAANTATSLQVSLVADDGAVVYLNGQEILRDNMPAGAVNATTLASSARAGTAESLIRRFTVSGGRLVAGTNVLAVEVHQSDPGSSDLSLDLSLTALP